MNQFMSIPEELKQLPQWVCHRNKMPFNPVTGAPAKAGMPITWANFEDCVNALDGRGYDGIGFEFNNNGIVGIDLDHVISDDGSLSAKAVEIVAVLDSYTEYSPSGKGLHIFVKGDIPVDGRKKGFVEMYKAKRYFTMTGNVYGELKLINERSEQVMQIFNKYFTNSVPVKSAIEAFKGSLYAKGKDDNHTAKLERSDYLHRTVKKAMQGLTSTAVSDNEKFIKKFAQGTAEIKETLKYLQPHIKYACDDKGNGELFADVFSSVARFNVTANEQFVYDGKVWIKDIGAMLVFRMAKQLKYELLVFSISIDNETQITAY